MVTHREEVDGELEMTQKVLKNEECQVIDRNANATNQTIADYTML